MKQRNKIGTIYFIRRLQEIFITINSLNVKGLFDTISNTIVTLVIRMKEEDKITLTTIISVYFFKEEK
ncbi:MAG: hypothetical protein DU481_09460 [Nitrosomonas sp.]|jgi:hypothetical protein